MAIHQHTGVYMTNKPRCGWVTADPIYIQYHDEEWGRPIHDDRLLFEFLILEGMQAGLSWLTVLKKRPHFREVFDHFDPEKMAGYSESKIQSLLQDPGIIRNRRKMQSVVQNAKAYLMLRESTTLSDYLWAYVDGKPILNQWRLSAEVPAVTPLSTQLSKDLKKKGFGFVGPTICYAFMQAVGMVNDHLTTCMCHPAFDDQR